MSEDREYIGLWDRNYPYRKVDRASLESRIDLAAYTAMIAAARMRVNDAALPHRLPPAVAVEIAKAILCLPAVIEPPRGEVLAVYGEKS